MILNTAVALVVLGLVFLPLEKLWPAHRGRFFRPGFGTDLLHFLFNGILTTVGVVILAIPVVVAIQATTPDVLRDAVAAQPRARCSSSRRS